MTIDFDLKELIPPLSKEERALLEESILEEGCRDPITYYVNHKGEDIILDGHNRFAICEKHGIPYPTREIVLPKGMNKEEWILLNQLGRRNIDPAVRIRLTKKMLYYRKLRLGTESLKIQSPESRPQMGTGLTREDREEISNKANVSTTTVDRHDFVDKHGTEDIIDRMDKGVISIGQAYNETRKALGKVKKAVEQIHPVAAYVRELNTWIAEVDSALTNNLEEDMDNHELIEVQLELLAKFRSKVNKLHLQHVSQ